MFVTLLTKNICSYIIRVEQTFEKEIGVMKTRRLTVLGRITCTLLIALLLMGATFTFNTIVGFNDASSDTQPVYEEITVAAGDTVWAIAQSYIDNDSDIRQAVHRICQVNEISADQLYAGQKLLIPEDL